MVLYFVEFCRHGDFSFSALLYYLIDFFGGYDMRVVPYFAVIP